MPSPLLSRTESPRHEDEDRHMINEAVILAALEAYSKTIDLIMAVREDMGPELRQRQWNDLLEAQKRADAFWDKVVARLSGE